MNQNADIYRQVGDYSEVMGASPHRLIRILIDEGIKHIDQAKQSIAAKSPSEKHRHLSKVGDIVRYLRQCLRADASSEARDMARQLGELYSFVESQLLKTASSNSLTELNKAEAVLLNISAGWNGIKNQG